jgi:hypothetical protein
MVIVDANTWAAVFDSSNKCHHEFRPVKEYVESTLKSLAWGGSRYAEELKKCPRYMAIHLELTKGSRAVRLSDHDIDKEEQRIIGKESDGDFDDPHIIAIQIVSKAPVICSADKRAFRFYKKKSLYPYGHKRPRIYSKKANRNLLRRS